MAKIQLTISKDYVAGWGVWEGIREILQNALDAEQDGKKMSVDYVEKTHTLTVSTRGVKLDSKVWLMGTTSKADGTYRGHFGEGLKLGVLALVRKGVPLKIINNDESWSCALEESDTFRGEPVLTIRTRDRAPTYAFTVEIGAIAPDAWEVIRQRFRHTADPGAVVVPTSQGDILLDENQKGRLYVKGIWVQDLPNLDAGYDLRFAETDRDRRMVDSYDLRYYTAKMWSEAVNNEAVRADHVLDMLTKGVRDVDGFESAAPEAKKAIADAFAATHGDALPVTSMAEAREAEHYGHRGVVVPAALALALQGADPERTLAAKREANKHAVAKHYGWSDLTDAERDVYTTVVGLVENAAQSLGYSPVEARLTIVDFRDENLNGLHSAKGIQIAHRLLADFEEALRVLVHEVAHDKGADGEKDHERAEGRLFARIVARLSGR